MSVSKEIREIIKDAFRTYPDDVDRAISYINRKLIAMKIPQAERKAFLEDLRRNRIGS